MRALTRGSLYLGDKARSTDPDSGSPTACIRHQCPPLNADFLRLRSCSKVPTCHLQLPYQLRYQGQSQYTSAQLYLSHRQRARSRSRHGAAKHPSTACPGSNSSSITSHTRSHPPISTPTRPVQYTPLRSKLTCLPGRIPPPLQSPPRPGRSNPTSRGHRPLAAAHELGPRRDSRHPASRRGGPQTTPRRRRQPVYGPRCELRGQGRRHPSGQEVHQVRGLQLQRHDGHQGRVPVYGG